VVLVGRDRECAVLERHLGSMSGAGSLGLLVEGEPGIGKTCLLDWVEAAARERCMTVLRCGGSEAEVEIGYAGLTDLLAAVADQIEHLPAHHRAALEAALAMGSEVPAAPFALGVATMALLVEVAARNPLVVLVDDVQWLDAASWETLRFAFRRLGDDRVVVVMAARSDGDGVAPPPDFDRLTLGGLDEGACALMLAELTGWSVPPTTVGSLATLTGGNPLALTEIARAAAPGELAAWAGGEVAVSTTVGQLLAQRVLGLPEATRRALEVVALSRSLSPDLLARVLDEIGEGIESLDPAEAEGLVSVSSGSVRFVHPLVRAAVADGIDPVVRRRVHRVLSGVLPQGQERAWHLAWASDGPDAEAAGQLYDVGARLMRIGGPGAAAGALETAAHLTPEGPDRSQRLVEAAGAAFMAGDASRAEVLLEELADVDDPMVVGQAAMVRAHMALMGGRAEDTVSEVRLAARSVDSFLPQLAAMALSMGSFACLGHMQARPAVELAEEALGVLGDADPGLRSIIDMWRANAALLSGDRAGLDAAITEYLARRTWLDEQMLVSGVAPVPVNLLVWGDYHDEVELIIGESIALARRLQAPAALPWLLTNRAICLGWAGRLQESAAAFAEAEALARHTGQDNVLGLLRVQRAFVAAYRGDAADCEALAASALSQQPARMAVFEVYAGHAMGLLELGRDRPEAALGHLESCHRIAVEHHLRFVGTVRHIGDLFEAQLQVGERRAAEETLEHLAGCVASAPRPFGLGVEARCRALLATSDVEAEAQYRLAIGHHRDGRLRLDEARDRLRFGEWLGERGRAEESTAELDAALRSFQHSGAAPWVDKADGARRASASVPTTPPDGGNPLDLLTPQQVQVALLLAEGQSNREIAAALFLSVRTVESHLSSVYRRVGVRSRAQLVRLVADGAR
jgi:DNA-binding CsgD family transcriptional regulator